MVLPSSRLGRQVLHSRQARGNTVSAGAAGPGAISGASAR
jgi:hypothetical protein